jgi:AhpD family alkylhydroperoxidase
MDARIDPVATVIGPKAVKHLVSADHALAGSTLPRSTRDLVKIRASQINGCGACLDMHVKEALAAGEDPLRLGLVAAWRETSVFTEAERAALELAEQGSRLADVGRVTDEAWAAAAEHYDEEQLTALVCVVAVINAFNRLNVMFGIRGGDYEPGHLG